ncbi:hypothetical protein [Moheibacter sp.]|uniref:hypothetical protein n=1 Tax=Moheibacter sp. TaxID=1965316 RepID=UPI003C72EB14
MKEKFGELFEYTHHFNHKVIEMMKTHKEILPERCFFSAQSYLKCPSNLAEQDSE